MNNENRKKKSMSWHYMLIAIIVVLIVNIYLSKGNIMFALGASSLPILLPLPLLLFIKDNKYLHYTIGMGIIFFMALYGNLSSH